MHVLSFLVLTASVTKSVHATALSLQSTLQSLDTAPVLHFPLARRGGPFSASAELHKDYANLAYLNYELERAENRFNLTRRVVTGNKLVRKAKFGGNAGQDGDLLMGTIADDGIWSVFLLFCSAHLISEFFMLTAFLSQVRQNSDRGATSRN